MSLTLNIPFTEPTNFIYDTDKIEIVGGKGRLKDQRPANATFYASYNSSINGNWGDGVLTGTPIGGAAILDGKLDLAHNDVRYVNYDADLNMDSQQQGCIRIPIYPNYSNAPASDQYFYHNAESNNHNYITIYHTTSGQLYILVANSIGNMIVNINFAWAPTINNLYELELNWYIDDLGGGLGATRFFINGIQQGITNTAIGTRDSSITITRIGSNNAGSKTSNFKAGKIIYYSTVQHVTDYTPDWSNIPETIYVIDNPYIELIVSQRLEALEGYTQAPLEQTGLDKIKSVIKKDNNWMYVTGGVWTVTSGTDYAESNTTAEIEADKITFTTIKVETKYRFFLHSEDGSTAPEIDLISISYNFAGEELDLTQTIIYGNVLDIGANISGELKVKSIYTIATSLITTNEKATFTFGVDGYFEAEFYTDDILPEFLAWYFPNKKMYKTNFLLGIHKFSELTILQESSDM